MKYFFSMFLIMYIAQWCVECVCVLGRIHSNKFLLLQGHDTVATAVCFSLLLLAENKDIQV